MIQNIFVELSTFWTQYVTTVDKQVYIVIPTSRKLSILDQMQQAPMNDSTYASDLLSSIFLQNLSELDKCFNDPKEQDP